MPQQTSPFTDVKWGWGQGYSGWDLGMDENLLKFSFLFDNNVDGIVSVLPAPTSGQAYFLTTDQKFYYSVNNFWSSSPCPKNFMFKDKTTGDHYVFNGVTADLVDSNQQLGQRLTQVESDTTPSSIKTLYESNPNTNEFSDADYTFVNALKLNAQVVPYKLRNVENRLEDVFSVLDYSSVQAAINALPEGGSLYFPEDYQWVGEVSLSGKKNITIFGNGAKLTAPGSRIRSFFNTTGSTGTIVIKGLIFDQKGLSMPLYQVSDYPNTYNSGIFGDGCEQVSVVSCQFNDLYTNAIKLSNCTGLTVSESNFSSGVQPQNQIIDHVSVTTADYILVFKSRFVNAAVTSPANVPCGVFASGIRKHSVVENNYFDYCGRNNAGGHRLAAIDFYYDSENTRIVGNVALNCMAQFLRLSACNNGLVEDNKIVVSGFAESGGTVLSVEGLALVGGINNGTKNVTVSVNEIKDEFNRSEVAVGIYAYDWGFPTRNVNVLHNTFTGCKYSVRVYGPYNGLSILNNKGRGYSNSMSITPTIGSVAITSTFGNEVDSVIDGLLVGENFLDSDGGVGIPAISFDSNKSPVFSGQVRSIMVYKNQMSTPNGSSAASQPAIYIRDTGSVKAAEAVVEGNASRFYTGLCTALTLNSLQFTGNRARFSNVDLLSGSSGNNITHRYGNSSAGMTLGGNRQGVSTLVAGTVTVSTPEAYTGATIVLSRQTSSGTLGTLSISAIVDKTSFTILSSSNTDTSIVYWEIIK